MKKIPVAEPNLSDKELAYVTDAVKSGWVSSSGEYITTFEQAFAEFCGTEHAIAVSNGTVSLHLALITSNVSKGDEVIIPDLTFAATANTVLYCGAKPVSVDIDPNTYGLDSAAVEKAITDKTKAIIPVHLYGHPTELDPLIELSEKHDLTLIEDAAEAHGAEYNGKKVGSIGEFGCFSFYGNKIMTTGEGGMITLNDAALADRIRTLRDHGMRKEKRYWHEEIGYNYRLTNMQAALGLAQVERLPELLQKKSEMATAYTHRFAGTGGLILPPSPAWGKSVYWMYTLRVPEQNGKSRDGLMEHLAQQGVDTRRFFYALHEMPPYQSEGKFPNSDQLSADGLCLPSSTTLTSDEITYICDQTLQYVEA